MIYVVVRHPGPEFAAWGPFGSLERAELYARKLPASLTLSIIDVFEPTIEETWRVAAEVDFPGRGPRCRKCGDLLSPDTTACKCGAIGLPRSPSR